jgi:hypothetical protein
MLIGSDNILKVSTLKEPIMQQEWSRMSEF